MTNSVDCQIMTFELTSGYFMKAEALKVKDLKWDKKQCIYCWDTLGLWSYEHKETDVN